MMKSFAVPSRRLAIFGLAVLLLGLPAVALRVLCVGRACDAAAETSVRTPFCSLPKDLRARISHGFRAGRSGEILSVTANRGVIDTGSGATDRPPWPAGSYKPVPVPIVFWGHGVAHLTSIAAGSGLDDIAPTVAELIGLKRPHAAVRSGNALEGVAAGSEPPRLVVELVWKGIGSEQLERQLDRLPTLARVLREGAATLNGDPVSLPADPAALMTTIGTGGIPSQHGMTGSLVRNDLGRLVRAWGKNSPVNVIATLGDHLDHATADKAAIALVGTEISDRGLIGGLWYPDGDRDLVSLAPRAASLRTQGRSAEALLRQSLLGRDRVPDLLGLVQEGSPKALDRTLANVIHVARRVSKDSVTFVLTATGEPASAGPRNSVTAEQIGARVEQKVPGQTDVLEAVKQGAFFLDQGILARQSLSDDAVLKALLSMRDAGKKLFVDAFPGSAVTFGRYCDG